MKNKLKSIRVSRNLTPKEVGKKIGRSAAYIEGVESGKNKLTDKIFLNLCGIYNVMGDEVFGLNLDGIDKAKCDDVLVDCCIWFLLDASQLRKVELSKKQLSNWTVFLHDAAIVCHLNVTQLRGLAKVIVNKR
jgi:transcriptional regulator with XRE-family HTH domain